MFDRIIDHPLPSAEPSRGLPIGNPTSRHFANLYLRGLDRFLKGHRRMPGYLRCDDFAVFAPAKPQLRTILAAHRELLRDRLRPQLREERTLLVPVT